MAMRQWQGTARRCKPEGGIQKAILQLLAYHKIPAWRINSGSYKSESGTFIRYGSKGMADIIAILPREYGGSAGKWLTIEVKAGKKKPTPAQITFAETINNAGGYAITARSIDDVIKFLGLKV